MSILWTLRKFVDPIQYGIEEDARRRQRETLQVTPQPGDGGPRVPPAQAEGALFRCRVCGHEEKDGRFCPRCLAGTMRRVTRR